MLGKLLLRYLKPYRWLLLGVLVFQFASALASLYLPSLNADIINKGVATGDTAFIWGTGAFMLAVSAGLWRCSARGRSTTVSSLSSRWVLSWPGPSCCSWGSCSRHPHCSPPHPGS